jgi:hypothetical protein
MKFIFLLIPPSPPNTVFTRLQPATGATASAVVPSATASQLQRKIPSFRNTGHGMSAAELAEFQQQLAMAQPSATGGASASQHQLPSTAGVGKSLSTIGQHLGKISLKKLRKTQKGLKIKQISKY